MVDLKVKIIALSLYTIFAIFIFIGGGFITNILFSQYDTSCVGIDTTTKLNIARLTIIMFWIVFTSPIAIGLAYILL